MDYVPGKRLDSLELDENTADDLTSRVANIITHLHGIKGADIPGPVGGGIPWGYLWGDEGAKTAFGSTCGVNRWLNKRLGLINKRIDLSPYSLVFCHMDLCRRNLILTENDLLYLLDWDSAGFFPRFYEIASISCYTDSSVYRDSPSLLEAVNDEIHLTDEEKHCTELLMRARAASLRYKL